LASVVLVTAAAVVDDEDDDECGIVVQAVPQLLSPSLVTTESAADDDDDDKDEDIALLILSFLVFHLSSSADISSEGRPNTVNRSSSSLSSVIPSTDVEIDLIICSLGRGTELSRA